LSKILEYKDPRELQYVWTNPFNIQRITGLCEIDFISFRYNLVIWVNHVFDVEKAIGKMATNTSNYRKDGQRRSSAYCRDCDLSDSSCSFVVWQLWLSHHCG
jgi:hypothetical protein